MAFLPWGQQPAQPPKSDPEPPTDYSKKEYGMPWEKRWWEEPWRGLFQTTPEGERGSAIPANWIRDIGFGILGGMGLSSLAPGVLGGTGGLPLGTTTLGASGSAALMGMPAWMGRHKLLTGLGGLGGYLGYEAMADGEPSSYEPGSYGAGQPPAPLSMPTGAERKGVFIPGVGYVPAPTEGGLPEPGEGMGGMGPEGEPQVITVGDQQFWWNPTGGMYGTGGWDVLPTPRAPGLTPEQQMEQAALDRAAALKRAQISGGMTPEQEIEQLQLQRQWDEQQAAQQREAQMQMLQMQSQFGREQQAAAAAQQMAQMYAADPYKYWAQMGQGTPEAVARLTGGEIAPGEQFGQVPLSTPSQQWWGNLLPSEQQQIGGGLNWLGVDPQDWFAMKQRMIPGMGSRQMGPTWAR